MAAMARVEICVREMGDAEFAHRRQAVQGQACARLGGRLDPRLQ